MSDWPAKLPAGSQDLVNSALFDAAGHVERYGGPAEITIEVFKRDLQSPLEVIVREVKKMWRATL